MYCITNLSAWCDVKSMNTMSFAICASILCAPLNSKETCPLNVNLVYYRFTILYVTTTNEIMHCTYTLRRMAEISNEKSILKNIKERTNTYVHTCCIKSPIDFSRSSILFPISSILPMIVVDIWLNLPCCSVNNFEN